MFLKFHSRCYEEGALLGEKERSPHLQLTWPFVLYTIVKYETFSLSEMDFSTLSSRWTALTTRNRLADPHFVYAVKTTKIYCRPSCAARLARRANIVFYNTPSAATKAGYRACKRCKPDSEPQDDPQDVAVAKACQIIRAALSSSEHANGHIGLNELAERVQLTPSYLHKTFKARMGVTPKAYAERLRLDVVGPAVMAQSEEAVVPDVRIDDAYAAFENDLTGFDFDLDFHFGDCSADLTSKSFSKGSTSINTPVTADWSWLDMRKSDRCELFDADALIQTMLAQEQAATDWIDQIQWGTEFVGAADDIFEPKDDYVRTSY